MSETATTADEAKAALYAALAKAQGAFPPIPREKTVTVRTREGPNYTFSYATLDAILAAVRAPLAENGLAVIQLLENPAGSSPALRTMLVHEGGGAVSASFPLGEWNSPQALGSKTTYFRRYALCAVLGVAAEEDDDGAQAAPTQPQSGPPAPDPDGEDSPFSPPEGVDAVDLTDAQRRNIYRLRKKLADAGAVSEEAFDAILKADYGAEKISELTKAQASALIDRLVRKEKELGA